MTAAGIVVDTQAEMFELGKERYVRSRVKAQQHGFEATGMSPVQSMMRYALDFTQAAIRDRRDRRRGSGRGRHELAVPFLHLLKPSTSAYIGLRSVFDEISAEPSVTSLGYKIGARIEHEVRFRKFAKEQPRLARYIKDKALESKAYASVVAWLGHAQNRTATPWTPWTHEVKVALGALVLELIIEAVPQLLERFDKPLERKRFRTQQCVRLTGAAEKYCEEEDHDNALRRPWYLPMTQPPTDWSPETRGGYTVEVNAEMVKENRPMDVEQGDMPVVYAAVNALQHTAWRINDEVRGIAEYLWDRNVPVAKLPVKQALTFPERPAGVPLGVPIKDLPAEQREAMVAWKLACRDVHNAENELKPRRKCTEQIFDVANMLKDSAEFYFPYQLDFRGRAYCMPVQLNPQGSDLARGLLVFAESMAMGPDGGRWLAIHGANRFGEDKVSMVARLAWVEEHLPEILATASDPLTYTWWQKAAEPWQFLAWCFEWARFIESGRSPEHRSCLPVLMDGSCNGLQHFSAMLRDEVGGAAVNLVPSDKPCDIYTDVLRATVPMVEALQDEPGEKGRLAREWLKSGLLDRAAVKRAVMTTPYGVTDIGVQNQITSHLNTLAFERGPLPLTNLRESAQYLAPLVQAAIATVVTKARGAMEYLQGLAAARSTKNEAVEWVTPSGFRVRQRYVHTSEKRVNTQLFGKLVIQRNTNRVAKRDQSNGIAPNFIHSLDAAHMMLTMQKMPGASWHNVHDCFGTHAGRAGELAFRLREEFAVMHDGHDFLAELTAGNPWPSEPEVAMPAPGTLDLGLVIESEYFFA